MNPLARSRRSCWPSSRTIATCAIRLDNVRNQLEESRLQVVQLQTNLERAEEAGLRDVVTAIGNRRFFDASFMAGGGEGAKAG